MSSSPDEAVYNFDVIIFVNSFIDPWIQAQLFCRGTINRALMKKPMFKAISCTV